MEKMSKKFVQIIFAVILVNIIISPVLAQSVDYWINQGKTYFNQERRSEAVEAYDKALAIESNNIDALYGKAVALTDISDLNKSGPTWVKLKEEIDKLLTANPKNAQAWVYKGDRLLFWGASDTDGVNSEQAYDKALSLDPNNVRAFIGKGNYKLGNQHYQDAVTFYDKALAIDPNNIEALYGKGKALAGLRKAESLQIFDKAIRLDPTNVNILGSKANALFQLQRSSEAIPVLEKTISINPNSAKTWTSLGWGYYFNCRFEESVQSFRKALTLNPDDLTKKLL